MTILHPAKRTALVSSFFSREPPDFRYIEGWLSDQLVSGNLNTKEVGDIFEVFAESFLRFHSILNIKEVYPNGTIPVDIQNRLRIGSSDRGIDGVFITHSDELGAYQVKFRSNEQTLSWTDLSTFIGLSEFATHRLVITNARGIAKEARGRPNVSSITSQDLRALTNTNLKQIWTLVRDGVFLSRPVLTPRPHQAVAINEILKELEVSPRATALMACGSGKTLVGLWVAEQILSGRKDARVVVLLPSLALVAQTLKEWGAAHSWGKKFTACCVCSDQTVTDHDEIEFSRSDLPIPVTTDPATIKRWLSGPGIRVVFSTYQSSGRIQEAAQDIAFDFAICDEAHRTARQGISDFTLPLDEERLSINRRLFMTATRRVFSEKIASSTTVHSMDNIPLYGQIAHSLNFRQAADQGIICPFKLIISVVTRPEVNRLLSEAGVFVNGKSSAFSDIARRYALSQAIKRFGLRKAFTFHKTVQSALDFVTPGSFGLDKFLPDFSCFHVSGAMSTANRESRMDEFQRVENGIVSNARCLNEGIDVPAVDVVAFMDPKRSMIDIVQAIGRALRKTDDLSKTHGYVMLPVFLDVDNDAEISSSLEGSEFHDVWYVLRALMAQDLQLTETIEKMRISELRGRSVDKDPSLDGFVSIISSDKVEEILRGAINVQVVNELGEFARCYARDPQPYEVIGGIEDNVMLFLEKHFGQKIEKVGKTGRTSDGKLMLSISRSDSEKYIKQFTFFNAITPADLKKNFYVIWSKYSRYGFIFPTTIFEGFLTAENSNKKPGGKFDWNVLTTYSPNGDFMKFAGEFLDVTEFRVDFGEGL